MSKAKCNSNGACDYTRIYLVDVLDPITSLIYSSVAVAI